MTPLARLNAAADAVQAAADRINLIGDSDVPAELARSLHNATETVTSSASAVRGTAWEWERTASTVRTAAAFGVEHVWLCGDSADPDHPSARKTALGTGRLLSFEQAGSAPAAAAAVKAAGLRLVAVELADGAVPLHDAAIAGDVCLALGNEDRGCSPGLLAAADQIAYIPQIGRVGSLNVAAAAAIVLAEARRREWGVASADGIP